MLMLAVRWYWEVYQRSAQCRSRLGPVTRQVTITDDGKKIVLTVGSDEVQVNGLKQTIDCAPVTLPLEEPSYHCALLAKHWKQR